MTRTHLAEKWGKQPNSKAAEPTQLVVTIGRGGHVSRLSEEEVRAGLMEVNRRCEESELRRARRHTLIALVLASLFAAGFLAARVTDNAPDAPTNEKNTGVVESDEVSRSSTTSPPSSTTSPPTTVPISASAYPLGEFANTRTSPETSDVEEPVKLTGSLEVVCVAEGKVASGYADASPSSVWYQLKDSRWINATVVQLRPPNVRIERCPGY